MTTDGQDPTQVGPHGAQSQAYPSYPQYPLPQYNYPVPPRRPWLWILVALAGVVVTGFVALVIYGLSSFGDPGPGYYDGGYYVEQTRVLNATEKPCEAMVSAGLEIRVFGTPAAGARSLATFAPTLRAVAAAVNGAHPNADARRWNRDLITLADSLDAYAKSLSSDPSTRYDMPKPARSFITGRMDEGAPVGCEIPITIDALDPAAASDFYGS